MLTVSEIVFDREQRPRWAVLATFVGLDGAGPRCVDYRVRVVPAGASGASGVIAAHQVLHALEQQTIPGADAESLGTIPPEGIPRYVFERASQTRLLEKARRKTRVDAGRIASAGERPGVEYFPAPRALHPDVAALLAPPVGKPGRPPHRSLAEKLRILARVEDAFVEGRPLESVARDVTMSRSALRDLLSWARKDASPRLFTSSGPGRRGGGLTDEARALLAEIEKAI